MPSSGVPTAGSGNPDTAGGRFVAAYTHQFGNGISGTLSLEDNKERKRGIYNGANALDAALGAGAAAVRCPESTPAAATPGLRSSASCASTRPGAASTSPATCVNNHVAYNCGAASGTTTVAAGGCSELSGNPWPTRSAAASTRRFRFNVPTGVNDALYIAGT